MPESTAHDAALNHIYALLAAWVARVGNGGRVARNLAFRWLPEHPRTGLDPDISLLIPAPPDFDDLTSLRLWEPGRTPPVLAIEVVSSGHPYKDYARVHEGYAAMGVAELLVFDPMLLGPKALGGPVALQLWQRDVSGAFERVHFGNDPVYSRVLDAWVSAQGRELRIADDRAASRRWPTLLDEAKLGEAAARAEAERSKAEAERSKAEAERSKAEAERSKAEAERSKAEAERSKAEAERSKADGQLLREAHERELALRAELERRLNELQAARGSK